MVSTTYSSTLLGIEAVPVQVETQIFGSLKRFTLVGLPDGVLREAKERVRCAIENSGFGFPYGDLVVNLAPATLPKAGSGFDLAIALSILAAAGNVDSAKLRNLLILGELGLNGSVRPVTGAVATACYVRMAPSLALMVPAENARQASLVGSVTVYKISTLVEAVGFINGTVNLEPVPNRDELPPGCPPDRLRDICGQHAAKRAMEIAAAGGHNLMFVGPPGSGKTMLATRMRSLMPPMSHADSLEVTKVHGAFEAATGTNKWRDSLIRERPFRAPHHTVSTPGLIGGGAVPIPGEVSLAHKGVLFLDEFNELRRDALESLREPLETKTVITRRLKANVRFPADFVLIAAMNPCPCGNRSSEGAKCSCPPGKIERYKARISGPIIDRIDLRVWVRAVPLSELTVEVTDDPTDAVRDRVVAAREIQSKRCGGETRTNSQLTAAELRKHCRLSRECEKVLEDATERMDLSARAFTRSLKVARTVADLAGAANIQPQHLQEVLSYRVAV